jgi:hypothetical protein
VSDQTPSTGGDRPWVPTPEQPVPPTTEFSAVTPEGSTPTGAPTASPTSVTPLASESTADRGGATAGFGTDAPPAWKTPPASDLPPAWGDPAAEQDAPQSTNQAKNLWGLVPEDRPEVLLGVALAGGVLAAILLRSLAKR